MKKEQMTRAVLVEALEKLRDRVEEASTATDVSYAIPITLDWQLWYVYEADTDFVEIVSANALLIPDDSEYAYMLESVRTVYVEDNASLVQSIVEQGLTRPMHRDKIVTIKDEKGENRWIRKITGQKRMNLYKR